jgi:hypothetical protein
MTIEKKEPKIGDIIRIIYTSFGKIEKETIGKIEGYETKDFGIYLKLLNQAPIFMESIRDWEILKIDNEKY